MSVSKVKVIVNGQYAKLSPEEQKENLEIAIKKFRRECQDYGILTELKSHEFYEKPSDKKRRAKKQRELQILKDKLKLNKRSKKKR